MPITIIDYVKTIIGEKDTYPAADFYSIGVAMTGGCEYCHAALAAYNAHPSTSGYWRCADCIGDDGYTTLTDFRQDEFGAYNCPACGTPDSLRETRITVDESTERYAVECAGCSLSWFEPA